MTAELHKTAGHCIVGCGWREVVQDGMGEHPAYCERTGGGHAEAVTEPGWTRTQFWCSVISPYNDGLFTQEELRAADRHRDGIQLAATFEGDPPEPVEEGSGWQRLGFNLTPGEARQLAAQLIAAADSHDQINQDDYVLRRLEKIARHVGADIWGA
ncbi:hypothetical protein [Mycolicibacterium poriferae]|uniref:hypothetical protein n=1 Tax=Mycolicibacterium poriferae TaxID=39694 RepID=UPI0024BA4224|nr:hypothetical protein [Mycolicibacterium poriferae]